MVVGLLCLPSFSYTYIIKSPTNLPVYANKRSAPRSIIYAPTDSVVPGKCKYLVLKDKLISGTHTAKHKS